MGAREKSNRKSIKKSKGKKDSIYNEPTLPKGEMSENSKSQVLNLVAKIVKSDEGKYVESINWLINSLKSAVDVKKDLENNSDPDSNEELSKVSFPLVPNGEIVEQALQIFEKVFTKLLKILGMSSPLVDGGGEGTEIFWRVPPYLTSEMIIKKIECLNEVLGKANAEDFAIDANVASDHHDESENDNNEKLEVAQNNKKLGQVKEPL